MNGEEVWSLTSGAWSLTTGHVPPHVVTVSVTTCRTPTVGLLQ